MSTHKDGVGKNESNSKETTKKRKEASSASATKNAKELAEQIFSSLNDKK